MQSCFVEMLLNLQLLKTVTLGPLMMNGRMPSVAILRRRNCDAHTRKYIPLLRCTSTEHVEQVLDEADIRRDSAGQVPMA